MYSTAGLRHPDEASAFSYPLECLRQLLRKVRPNVSDHNHYAALLRCVRTVLSQSATVTQIFILGILFQSHIDGPLKLSKTVDVICQELYTANCQTTDFSGSALWLSIQKKGHGVT